MAANANKGFWLGLVNALLTDIENGRGPQITFNNPFEDRPQPQRRPRETGSENPNNQIIGKVLSSLFASPDGSSWKARIGNFLKKAMESPEGQRMKKEFMDIVQGTPRGRVKREKIMGLIKRWWKKQWEKEMAEKEEVAPPAAEAPPAKKESSKYAPGSLAGVPGLSNDEQKKIKDLEKKIEELEKKTREELEKVRKEYERPAKKPRQERPLPPIPVDDDDDDGVDSVPIVPRQQRKLPPLPIEEEEPILEQQPIPRRQERPLPPIPMDDDDDDDDDDYDDNEIPEPLPPRTKRPLVSPPAPLSIEDASIPGVPAPAPAPPAPPPPPPGVIPPRAPSTALTDEDLTLLRTRLRPASERQLGEPLDPSPSLEDTLQKALKHKFQHVNVPDDNDDVVNDDDGWGQIKKRKRRATIKGAGRGRGRTSRGRGIMPPPGRFDWGREVWAGFR